MFKLEKDTSVWNSMKKNLNKGSNKELKVGWFESDVYGSENDNLPVAQVAKWNEEGSESNPTRPFIRVGFMAPIKKGMYDGYFIESIQRIAEGKSTFTQEYRKLGPIAKQDLQEVIEGWTTPPNSPVTIALKGRDDPLVDTGKMHDSVGWQVGDE